MHLIYPNSQSPSIWKLEHLFWKCNLLSRLGQSKTNTIKVLTSLFFLEYFEIFRIFSVTIHICFLHSLLVYSGSGFIYLLIKGALLYFMTKGTANLTSTGACCSFAQFPVSLVGCYSIPAVACRKQMSMCS